MMEIILAWHWEPGLCFKCTETRLVTFKLLSIICGTTPRLVITPKIRTERSWCTSSGLFGSSTNSSALSCSSTSWLLSSQMNTVKSTPTRAISFTPEERSLILRLWPWGTTSISFTISTLLSFGQTQRAIQLRTKISPLSSRTLLGNQRTNSTSMWDKSSSSKKRSSWNLLRLSVTKSPKVLLTRRSPASRMETKCWNSTLISLKKTSWLRLLEIRKARPNWNQLKTKSKN